MTLSRLARITQRLGLSAWVPIQMAVLGFPCPREYFEHIPRYAVIDDKDDPSNGLAMATSAR
ncbi:MAG: hypothetical protein IPM82_24510 [Saprospiraceae bacterium]|nr:hypothetical protein [Saprospiraceae bacterium]